MKTWGELKSEIKAECNIEGEEFVSDDELLAWANDAKDEAEAEIVSLFDKYLETSAKLTLTEGVPYVSLPPDIYANKITGLWYDDGNCKYEIKLIKRKEEIHDSCPTDRYKFYFDNSTAEGIRLVFVPTPRETTSDAVTCYYIRESQPIIDDNSRMDIPIADAFIKQYVKDKIQEKELGPLAVKTRSALLEKQKALLIEALNQMVPSDSADELEADTSIYEDFGDCYGSWY